MSSEVASASAQEPALAPNDVRIWPRPELRPPPPPPRPCLPAEALPPLPAAQIDALREAAFAANDRYLIDFVETYGFCPYARKGRRLGQVHRYLHYADTTDTAPLVALMQRIAADPQQAVVQVVMPLLEVSGREWIQFCQDLTTHANHELDRENRMATAALHPKLSYRTDNPFSLLTLFRRSPDPTIQWVRLDAVRALYEGRDGGTRAISLDQVDELLARPPMAPLYDRIAITNATMARRMRVEFIDQLLAGYHADAQQAYHRILLDPRFDKGL